MQSQQAWTISQHLASPLWQVMQQPSLVFSHVQWQQHRLMLQIWMPFQVQQHEQVPWQRAWQRFCSVAAAMASSHLQWILQPVLVFSNFSVQRGTTQMFGAGAVPWFGCAAAGMAPVAKALRLERSNTALDITELLWVRASVNSCRRGRRVLLIQLLTETRDLWDDQSATPASERCMPPEAGRLSAFALW
jgi:hypothetical protein